MPKKIKYGLSNVWIAKANIADDGSATYEAPFRFPGAVNLSLEQEGELSVFYADNIKYWQGAANNGYSGSFEAALVPDKFKTDILGMVLSSDKVMLEDTSATGSPFAMMFQFEDDINNTRFVLYNCVATRPAISGSTKEASIEPQTETLDIEVGSIWVPAANMWLAKANTGDETEAATINTWFDAPYIPGEQPAPGPGV